MSESIEIGYDLNRACLWHEALKSRRFDATLAEHALSRSINAILARLSYEYVRLLRWL